MSSRIVGSVVAFCALLAPLTAQDAEQEQDPQAVEKAVAKWLDSDHRSERLLEKTVAVVLKQQDKGIPYVGELLKQRVAKPGQPRSKAIGQLATTVALAFLQRESSRSLMYAGQYLPLRPLQPFVGELYFSWLIDTPDWYPESHRIALVPALRDLQPVLPGRRELEGVLRIVENEEIEPDNLREALECLLWQWGRKERAKERVDELVRATIEGEVPDRARAMLRLAELWYDLREYKRSASTYRSVQALASTTDLVLKPSDWYASACSHALSGQVERGIEALAKCAELQASKEVDSSWKVETEVFDEDPEIDALRQHPRFEAIVQKAKKGSGEVVGDPWKRKVGK